MTKKTANWRLLGGGGLVLGGLLWAIGAILAMAGGGAASGWLSAIGLLVVGVAHLFVAFGETGSNGAVGASGWGKVVLVAAALGWVLLGVVGIIGQVSGSAPSWLSTVGIVLALVGGILSAIAIFGRGVAKGIAKWAMFVPVILAAVFYLLGLAGMSAGYEWLGIVVAVTFLLTGLAYLFNKMDVGK
ncbi:MAG: hypothetical protein R2717_07005 [Schumannella sp.]|nr:hypothetical protein [Microbacteriaceae bacterium]